MVFSKKIKKNKKKLRNKKTKNKNNYSKCLTWIKDKNWKFLKHVANILGTSCHTSRAYIILTGNSKHLYRIHSVAIKQTNEVNIVLIWYFLD